MVLVSWWGIRFLICEPAAGQGHRSAGRNFMCLAGGITKRTCTGIYDKWKRLSSLFCGSLKLWCVHDAAAVVQCFVLTRCLDACAFAFVGAHQGERDPEHTGVWVKGFAINAPCMRSSS
jgi:hypothetical protein